MKTKKVKFVQIAIHEGEGLVFCLSDKGDVWVSYVDADDVVRWIKVKGPEEEA